MRRIAVLIFLLSATTTAAPQPARVLLAVFAHPDDETFVGPALARYAREGVKVYLAIATKGEKGTNEHAGIAAGDPLAAARHAEAICACQQLGIQSPIFFDLNDGELGAMTNPLGKNVQAVADNVEKLILKLHPQVVITWGPDGGYGHPDHRLVSDAVTQVIQSQDSSSKLFFAAFSPQQAKPLNAVWASSMPWHTTDSALLTANVPFSKEDQAAYHRAFECHKSQYTADEFAKIEKALDEGWAGHVLFRPWIGKLQSETLFD